MLEADASLVEVVALLACPEGGSNPMAQDGGSESENEV